MTETISHGDIAENGDQLSETELTVTFSNPPAVTANEGYAILLSTQATGGEHYDIYYQTGNAYAGGNALEKASGGAWAKPPAITDYDFSFKVVTTYTQ